MWILMSAWYVWTCLSLDLLKTAVLLFFASLSLPKPSEPELYRFGCVGWIHFEWSAILFQSIFGNRFILFHSRLARKCPTYSKTRLDKDLRIDILRWESINVFFVNYEEYSLCCLQEVSCLQFVFAPFWVLNMDFYEVDMFGHIWAWTSVMLLH